MQWLPPRAREKKMGVIAMKMVRAARNADLKGSDLIRYALGEVDLDEIPKGL